MPTDLIIKLLNLGVIGLCAIAILATWRVLQTEQRRSGTPRVLILRSIFVFMGFCTILSILIAYVQLNQANSDRKTNATIQAVGMKLAEVNNLLCDKIFHEIREVQRKNPDQDTTQIAHLVKRLQIAVEEAASYTDASQDLKKCLA